MSELYRVIKIYDLETNKPVFDKRMYGQAAFPFVPTIRAQRVMYDDKKKDELKALAAQTFRKIWRKQSKLKPVIGFPIYFLSVKPDAGWFRTAPVTDVAYYEGVPNFQLPRMVIKTETSVYLVEVDD